MAKIDVIVRFVAHEGRETQRRALLQGMLTPIPPNRAVDYMNVTTRGDASIGAKHERVRRRLLDSWQRRTSNA
jgi:hypothetical protein